MPSLLESGSLPQVSGVQRPPRRLPDVRGAAAGGQGPYEEKGVAVTSDVRGPQVPPCLPAADSSLPLPLTAGPFPAPVPLECRSLHSLPLWPRHRPINVINYTARIFIFAPLQVLGVG